jgi:hypothetical protein
MACVFKKSENFHSIRIAVSKCPQFQNGHIKATTSKGQVPTREDEQSFLFREAGQLTRALEAMLPPCHTAAWAHSAKRASCWPHDRRGR